MAFAVVDARDFRDGQLPDVCVLSGEPADNAMLVRATSPPPYVLLLFGILPFLIASWLSTSGVDGQVPIRHARYLAAARRLRRWRVHAGVAGGLVVVAVALLLMQDPALRVLAGVSALAGAGALGAGVRPYLASRVLFVRPRLRRDPTWIDLRSVHERFAAAADGDVGVVDR